MAAIINYTWLEFNAHRPYGLQFVSWGMEGHAPCVCETPRQVNALKLLIWFIMDSKLADLTETLVYLHLDACVFNESLLVFLSLHIPSSFICLCCFPFLSEPTWLMADGHLNRAMVLWFCVVLASLSLAPVFHLFFSPLLNQRQKPEKNL